MPQQISLGLFPSFLFFAALALNLSDGLAATAIVAGNAAVEGGSNDIAPLYTNSVTAVMVISSSELGSIPFGSSIEGISWRLDGSANRNQPGGVRNFADFDVFVGSAAVTPQTMQNQVADNYVPGTRTQVRDGGLRVGNRDIDVGDGAGGDPAPFSFEVSFDTAFTYAGGDIVIEYTHTGSGRNSVVFDGLTIPGQTTINQFVALSFGATSVFQDNSVGIPQVRFTAPPTPVPEPMAPLMLTLGAMVTLFRRNRA